ncbi:FAST kinase domain-containing protein 4 [Antennarius striatus]|uniref:FAST kinase domain-containing protein 4 n=1 Tax=Antennarius striatus TaxID=241820 RepID=UPI0035B19482
MATRLFSRCAILLSRTSLQTPAASFAAARLPVLLVGPGLHRAQGLPLVTEWLMFDRRLHTPQNTDVKRPVAPPLDVLLQKATVPEEVLQAWEENKGNADQAAKALVKLTYLILGESGKLQEQANNIMGDSRVKEMMNLTSDKVTQVWNSTLVSVWYSLTLLDLPPTDSVLGHVQAEVLWRIRRLSYKQLSYLVDKGLGSRTQNVGEVVNAALEQLELRWVEISHPQIVRALITRGKSLSPSFMEKLEHKALEYVEHFSSQDIRKICVSLAVQNRRPIPLLRALSYHLLLKPSSDFTLPLIMDMAFTFGKLGFHQCQLLQQMSTKLVPEVPQLSSTEVVRCAKSLALLKWLHIPLFDAFAKHYLENSEKYRPHQICNLLMTFARVNFLPSSGDFFSKVHAVLEPCLSDLEPFLHTDVVWSLCVLQQAKPQYLIPLTHEDHVKQVSGSSVIQVGNYTQKLRHIAATLQLEHLGTSDPPPSLSGLPVPVSSAALTPLQNSLRETLQSFAAQKTASLRIGVQTVYGWTIDGELLLDCENNLIGLTMLKAPHLPSGGGHQDLPAGSRQIAFLTWEFSNFCTKSKNLMGRFVMMKRHLQLAGFLIVEVPYYEWQELKTDSLRLGWLKDKINKVVAEDMAHKF